MFKFRPNFGVPKTYQSFSVLRIKTETLQVSCMTIIVGFFTSFVSKRWKKCCEHYWTHHYVDWCIGNFLLSLSLSKVPKLARESNLSPIFLANNVVGCQSKPSRDKIFQKAQSDFLSRAPRAPYVMYDTIITWGVEVVCRCPYKFKGFVLDLSWC